MYLDIACVVCRFFCRGLLRRLLHLHGLAYRRNLEGHTKVRELLGFDGLVHCYLALLGVEDSINVAILYYIFFL